MPPRTQPSYGPRLALMLSIIVSLATATACDLPPQQSEHASDASVPVDSSVLAPMFGFSWVRDERLAAMPRPGARRLLAQDLNFLRQRDIRFLVSLTVTPTDLAQARDHDIVVHHIPVPDFTAPSQAQIREFVFVVDAFINADVGVGVHCGAGLGRSGTMVAAYFVSLGMTAAQAIAKIRLLRPGSIETLAQEQSIFDYAECACRTPGPHCRCGLEQLHPTVVD